MSRIEYFTIDHQQSMKRLLIDEFHRLWNELHSKQDPDQAWFDDWLLRVPNFGCGCQDNFRKYVKDNPPDFDDFYRWSVNAHNWVNAKLGKSIWNPIDSK